MIELFDSICGHGWDNGVLMLRIKWKTDEESVMAFTMVKQDYPYETAEYILQNKVGTSEHKYATRPNVVLSDCLVVTSYKKTTLRMVL
jgi:hypothetical protein